MRHSNRNITGLVILIMLWPMGCASFGKYSYVPINERFGYRYRARGVVHRSSWAELRTKSLSRGSTLVWPIILDTQSVVVTNNLAVFLGTKAIEVIGDTGRKEVKGEDILLAVRAGEMPCDISKIVLKIWSDREGYPFSKAVTISDITKVRPHRQGIEVVIIFWMSENIPTARIILPWSQVEEMLSRVQQGGQLVKEKSSGMTYREADR